jgi:type II secretory pathway pseudopilin PulG
MGIRRKLALIRGDDGMTIVEVMVAALILVTGALAVLGMVGTAARGSYRDEQSQVVSNRLQSEMEQILQLPYDRIALTGIPADSNDTNNPAWRIQGTSYAITQDGTNPRALVYNGSSLASGGTVSGGSVSATPTTFASGDVHGTIYRYVVWENDPSCPEVTCPGSQDLKRVIVAIRLDGGPVGGAVRHYQELQSQLSNPATSPVNDPNPGPACTGGADCQPDGTCTGTNCTGGGGNTSTPWTFWLTDTSCNNTARQPVAGDHLTHNTRGNCATGVKSGNDPGAPDLIVNQAAPLVAETPLYDYATDVEPSQNPDQDKGLQMLRPSTAGCDAHALTVASGAEQDDPTRFQELHEWLSSPIPAGYDVALDGSGTLNLWTQSVNAASYAGEICVWLFVQSTDAGGNPVRTAATNPSTGASYFTYQQATWPTGWTETHIPLSFSLGAHLTEGTRVGLAIGVDRDGTGADGMQLLYDEPSFDSRLELKTHSSPPSL